MKLFFSGGGSRPGSPEVVLFKKKPAVMLTYWEIHNKQTALRRFRRHKERLQQDESESK